MSSGTTTPCGRRCVGSGGWPAAGAGRAAGQALVHVPLADLMLLEGSSALMREWSAGVRAAWAAHRAGASAGGSDGGAWLDGAAARAASCDASVTPVVTGEVDPAVLEDMVRLCVQLDKLRRHHARTSDSNSGDGGGGGGDGDGDGGAAGGTGGGGDSSASPGAPGPDAPRARDTLEQAIIGKAVGLVSGPGGLASFLRRRHSAPGWAAPACRWMWGCPATSRPRSAGR